jgi:hypothetical protein
VSTAIDQKNQSWNDDELNEFSDAGSPGKKSQQAGGSRRVADRIIGADSAGAGQKSRSWNDNASVASGRVSDTATAAQKRQSSNDDGSDRRSSAAPGKQPPPDQGKKLWNDDLSDPLSPAPQSDAVGRVPGGFLGSNAAAYAQKMQSSNDDASDRQPTSQKRAPDAKADPSDIAGARKVVALSDASSDPGFQETSPPIRVPVKCALLRGKTLTVRSPRIERRRETLQCRVVL